MTGASATRTWLQAQHLTWLTPKRMKVATIGIFTAAALGSSMTLGGSTAPTQGPHQAPAAPAAHSSR